VWNIVARANGHGDEVLTTKLVESTLLVCRAFSARLSTSFQARQSVLLLVWLVVLISAVGAWQSFERTGIGYLAVLLALARDVQVVHSWGAPSSKGLRGLEDVGRSRSRTVISTSFATKNTKTITFVIT
jgi:hypothetical protein